MQKQKIIVIILLIAIFVFIGFVRIYVFVNINNQLKETLNNPTFFYKNEISWVANWSPKQLNLLKWVLTMLFSLVYLLLSCFTIWFVFKTRLFVKITAGAFLILLILSFLVLLVGSWGLDSGEKAYSFSRYLMGIVQSPLIPMILIPLFSINAIRKRT